VAVAERLPFGFELRPPLAEDPPIRAEPAPSGAGSVAPEEALRKAQPFPAAPEGAGRCRVTQSHPVLRSGGPSRE
jgi:hypothetical protein